MKKITIFTILVLTLGLGFSFKSIQELKKQSAEVLTEDGLLVFCYSKPLKKYKVIGNVKTNKTGKKLEDAVFDLSQKAKKTYPTAEALIVKSDSYTVESEVIEFEK